MSIERNIEVLADIAPLVDRLADELARVKAENVALRAKLERLKPRGATVHDAVGVLNKFKYLGLTGWYVSGGDKVRCGQQVGYLNGFEAIAVAEKLERDSWKDESNDVD